MKLLLITESEELRDRVAHEFRPHQVEIIRYFSPLKGMDNLDEIAPDVVLFSAEDFPRHWKTFLTFLRNSYARDRMVFVLLTGRDFDAEEASKAQHLGVNAVVDSSFESKQELNRLRDIITRYKRLSENRNTYRHTPDQFDRVGFLFSHPVHLRLIAGTVEDISSTGLRFVPYRPELVQDLRTGGTLKSCSLRIGEEIVSLDCTVMRNTDSLGLGFEEIDNDVQRKIGAYIEDHTRRAMGKGGS
ncbi:MAG: PilZ domain-containing protein [Spirochaetaceae bacterium]